ncbi:recombinase family protein [Peribacillus frigoritolerans]|uniref:recombinase family protein n=1 Tax=Peribacillus TaxID=2675229 RepID=UPI0035A81832
MKNIILMMVAWYQTVLQAGENQAHHSLLIQLLKRMLSFLGIYELFNILGSFAQFERDLIVERTTDGRERAKKTG